MHKTEAFRVTVMLLETLGDISSGILQPQSCNIKDELNQALSEAFEFCELKTDEMFEVSANLKDLRLFPWNIRERRFLAVNTIGCFINTEDNHSNLFIEVQGSDRCVTQFIKNCGAVCVSWRRDNNDKEKGFYAILVMRKDINNWEVRLSSEKTC